MVKRGWLYLKRKYKRNIFLFLLLFVVSFSISVGLCVWNSINGVTKEVQKALGTSFIVKLPSYVQNPDYSRTVDVEAADGTTIKAYAGPVLNDDIVDNVMQVEGIAGYNADKVQYIYIDDLKLITGLFADQYEEDDPHREVWELLSQETSMYGNTDTSLADKFRTGSFTLVEGRHITPKDRKKVLISDELAELNHLSVGDNFTVSLRVGMSGNYPNNMDVIGEPQTLEIIGIFHVNGYQPAGEWIAESDITYNWIFADAETAKYLRSLYDEFWYQGYIPEMQYNNITFFVEDPAQLETIVEEVKNLDTIDTTFYDISLDDTMYQFTVEPLNTIRNIIVGAIAAIVIGCMIVLCIVFTMWVRSRRQEIAIYLSMGMSKASILGQFLLEAAMIALIAGVLSFAVCQKVPDIIGNELLAVTIEDAQPEEKEYTQEELHEAAMSGTTSELFRYESSDYAGPEHIDFTFHITDFIILLLLELVIIIAAICKGSAFLFRLQPKQIMIDLR